MSDEAVYAIFEPSEPQLLVSSSNTRLLAENPILVSALSNIFPFLIFFDNLLEIITWTNDDPYQNFLFVVCYSVLVLYWRFLKYWIVPFFIVLVLTSLVWHTNSVVYDSKFGERPTVEEVLLTLHNITARFEIFLRPAKRLELTAKNYFKLAVAIVAITPLHVLVLKTVLSPASFTWIVGTIFLTLHSPWAISIRRLLWRSVYVRILAFQLTGLDIRLSRRLRPLQANESSASSAYVTEPEDNSPEIAHTVKVSKNYTVLRKVIVSPTRLKQTVKFEILENERRWIGLGWTKLLFPSERANYCYQPLMLPAPDPNSDLDFSFPTFDNVLYSHNWQWADDVWTLDSEYNHNKSESGWAYLDTNWENPVYHDGFSRYTRSRKWIRRAVLLIDKQSEVLDG